MIADSGSRAVSGVGLKSLACWECGFESRGRHESLRLRVLCIVRYRSLRRADHSYRGVLLIVVCLNECYLEISTMRSPRATSAVEPWKKIYEILHYICYAYKHIQH